MPDIKRMLGDTSIYGKPAKRMLGDRDKDKVRNVFDCQPNNPNKQGIFHRVGAVVARKVGAEERARIIERRGKEADIEKKQREAARVDIRKKAVAAELRIKREETIKTTETRERRKGEMERQRIKQGRGTFFGQFKSGFKGAGKALGTLSSQVRPMPLTGARAQAVGKPQYKYVKKGKHYKRVRVKGNGTTVTTQQPPAKRETLTEYMNKIKIM